MQSRTDWRRSGGSLTFLAGSPVEPQHFLLTRWVFARSGRFAAAALQAAELLSDLKDERERKEKKERHPVLIMFMPERRLPSACRIPCYVAAIFWQLPSIAHVLTLIVVSSAPRLCTSQVTRCESSPLFYYSGEAIVGQRLAVSPDRWSCSRFGKALISLSVKEPQTSHFILFAPWTELKLISQTFHHTTTFCPPSYCHKVWLKS